MDAVREYTVGALVGVRWVCGECREGEGRALIKRGSRAVVGESLAGSRRPALDQWSAVGACACCRPSIELATCDRAQEGWWGQTEVRE